MPRSSQPTQRGLLYPFFFFNDTATTEIYTLSLHGRSSDLHLNGDVRRRAEPVEPQALAGLHSAEPQRAVADDARAEQGRSEEHTSELQSRLHLVCRLLLEKKKNL